MRPTSLAAIAVLFWLPLGMAQDVPLERLPYNHPGLVVDLGVGLWAWPLPMDYDRDGDLDLLVSCPDIPYNGTYFFENPGGGKLPVFRPAVRLGDALSNASISYADGQNFVLTPGHMVSTDAERFGTATRIHDGTIHKTEGRIRANQWKYVDYDADGALDLVVGIGDWTDYGWDNAYNAQGEWTNGPLHGWVYLLRNSGTTTAPQYDSPVKIMAGDAPVDVYGMPSPNFADFDGDGDLDLLCGEFVDGFTYFENVGTRSAPKYAAGRPLARDGAPMVMELCMIVVVAIDWTADGHPDLVVGQEDGRVALMEHTGRIVDGMPVFDPPVFFQQEAQDVKFGALVTPVSFDWDGDGDEDIVAGNTAGNIGFIENLDGGSPPKWAAPALLEAAGETIHIQAGINGSIQGPCERKWGYTTLSVADWDHDGLPDIVANSIWGKVVWYRNTGTRTSPALAAAAPVEVAWEGAPPKPAWTWWNPQGKELATQWRTTPVVVDWDEDGLNDLVMLDHEGYLALFRRERRETGLVLLPGERVFALADAPMEPLRLNAGEAGKSGRRKISVVDWDGDGRRDLLVNDVNANLLRNISSSDAVPWVFEDLGPFSTRKLAGHTTSPTFVDWDGDGRPALLIGAEDGYLYYGHNQPQPGTP